LPEQLDVARFTAYERGFVAYALDMPGEQLVGSVARDALLERGALGVAVLAAYARAGGDGVAFDFGFFRRGFHRFYSCARGFPVTLDAFRADWFDYAEVAPTVLLPSVKGAETPRHLYGGGDAECDLQVSVAETLEGDEVRETEVLLRGARLDGPLEFVAYDASGRLMYRSAVTAVSGSEVIAGSPFVCMSCHFDTAEPAWRFERFVGRSAL
jgi:hypothetical protein